MSTILIAENEAATRKRLEKLLTAENLDVRSVADGRMLLKKMEDVTPDLVLLDLAMPKIDGIKVIEKLREDGRGIPVVVMAGKNAVHAATEALERGADGYISKPVNKKNLLLGVQRALARARRAGTMLEVPLRELHDPATGRIDAKRVAGFLTVPVAQLAVALNANYQTVHKTPAAPSLQKALGSIKRTVDLLSRVTRGPADARAWLNNPHPDLGDRTPLDVILTGRAEAVVTLLENALAGIPS